MLTIKEISKMTSSYNALYVEDDEVLAPTVIEYLSKFFKNVIYAKNGKEGLSLYKQNDIDIVFTDIEMPLMSGLEMSEKIKEVNKEQIIIIISAYSDADMFVASATLGIDGYVIKPINYTDLINLLHKMAKKIKIYEENNFDKKEIIELNNKILEQQTVIQELEQKIHEIKK